MVGSNISSGLGRFALCETLESRKLFASVGTDASFNGGQFFTQFYGISESANEVVVLKDGRVLVGGHAEDAAGKERAVFALYNKNGTLGTSFDGDGKLILSTAATGKIGSVLDLQLTKDGNILVVGVGNLQKLKSNGTVDTSFGNAGYAALPTANDNSQAVVLADGSIRYGSYDGVSGVLRSATYSPTGKSTQSLRRSITRGGGEVLVTSATLVLPYATGTARAFRPDLSIESKFGRGGVLDLKPAVNAWIRANGPWYEGDTFVRAPAVDYSLDRSAWTKTGYAFFADTTAVSEKVPETNNANSTVTEIYAYANTTGTTVNAGGGPNLDGKKLPSTYFEPAPTFNGTVRGTFTTPAGKNVFFEPEGFTGGEFASAGDVASAGGGKYYVVGGSFQPGDVPFEDNYYGFLVTKTAFVG